MTAPLQRYRWCVHCGADCWPEPHHQRHQLDCPAVTGVFPVLPGALGRCTSCGQPFGDTDCYALVEHTDGLAWVICLGCAAQGRHPGKVLP